MKRRHCRCRKCGARQVHRLEGYAPPASLRCRKCSEPNSLIIDKWADSKGWRVHTCECTGYQYPHRRGSPDCYDRKDGTPKSYEELYGEPEPQKWIDPELNSQ